MASGIFYWPLQTLPQVIRAGWGNFRSMVAGYDVVEIPEATPTPNTMEETR